MENILWRMKELVEMGKGALEWRFLKNWMRFGDGFAVLKPPSSENEKGWDCEGVGSPCLVQMNCIIEELGKMGKQVLVWVFLKELTFLCLKDGLVFICERIGFFLCFFFAATQMYFFRWFS